MCAAPVIHISTPLSEATARGLKVGDAVRINGTIIAARDAAHKRLIETLQAGQPLPVPLRDQIIYYVGPTPARPGYPIGAAGPTTAGRMDDYTVPLLELGLRGMIGKGRRSPEVIAAMQKHGAVFFAAVGGAGALRQGVERILSCAYLVGKFAANAQPRQRLGHVEGGDYYIHVGLSTPPRA